MENKTITIELTKEQYEFLEKMQKTHEQELGIEIPLSSMVRKAVDSLMKSSSRPPRESRESRPERSDRDRSSAPRKSFGMGGRGPKFDMLGAKNKTRNF